MAALIFIGSVIFVVGTTVGLAAQGNLTRIVKLLLLAICGVALVVAGLLALEQLADFAGWVAIALILLVSIGASTWYAATAIRAFRSKDNAPALHLAAAATALTVLGLLYLGAGYYAAYWGFVFLIFGSVAAVFSLFANRSTESIGIRNAALLIIGIFWMLSGTAMVAAGDEIPGVILLAGFVGLIIATFPQLVSRFSRLRRPTLL